jgi:hypothetical protein
MTVLCPDYGTTVIAADTKFIKTVTTKGVIMGGCHVSHSVDDFPALITGRKVIGKAGGAVGIAVNSFVMDIFVQGAVARDTV